MPERPEATDVLGELATLAAELGGAVGPPGDAELLDAIAAAGRVLFDAGSCSVALLDDPQEELVFRAASGRGAEGIVGVRLPVDRGIAGWAVSSGQATAVEDVARDPRFARDVAENTGYIPTAIFAAPLQTERETIGVISVLDPQVPDGEQARRLQQLGAYAEPVALAIESSRRFWDMGRALLDALRLTAEGVGLQATLREAADRPVEPRAELVSLAAQFAELGRYGPAEQAAAGALVQEFLGYLRSRANTR